MKKVLILALAIVMAGTMAACGMGDVGGTPAPASSSAASQPVSSAVSADSMDDNLSGLVKYLAANSVLFGNQEQMKADFIGAKKGVKYQFSYNGKDNVTVELYEFDTSLNSTAQTVFDEIKAKGSFKMMSQEVPAVISDNGKYLMVYKDTVTSDQNQKRQDEVTKLFKEFKK
ncbi:hypothetical protein FL966_08960 [Caproiciproducens galactitolivorans]|uniref:DUF4367 domain-containing protein n=1 Tax=Caproiciproducens galactitolivorans TaxID=642589 RepID=A0A4Z0YGR5_9FIRM|nr:hypothetical protein [Caproiciproducens galactitolivorans]QEY35155.1 hypothetical protein FL966_08960 [Caproiciproducens galactitolivorans]TGJ76846.1 hypothetical protein CAGA_09160 [Caproiciproducens galactitolivorans]